MDEPKQSLNELIVKRSSIKGQITKFRKYVEGLSDIKSFDATECAELSLRLTKFETLSVRFDELQSQIEVYNSSNLSTELDERDKLERDIVSCTVKAERLIKSFNSKTSPNDSNTSSQNVTQCHLDHSEINFKLPQIQVTKFDGSFFKWLEFRDTFTSLIHENNRISPINKFHYLISYLEGDAARVISNLEVSSSTYKEAWRLLLDRYDNKRLLVNHHLNALFNIQPIAHESDRALRFLIDHVSKNLRALSSLGQDTDKWDVLIIHMLTSKLDSQTLVKWEERRSALKDIPTLQQFNKFIIDRADVLESLSRNKMENSPKAGSSNTIRRPLGSNNKNQPLHVKSFTSTNTSQTSSFSLRFPCSFCKGQHRICDCSSFKSLAVQERITEANKLKLCLNCLRSGHSAAQCRLGSCRLCKVKHNTLLHSSDASNETIARQDTIATFSNNCNQMVILSTAIIKVINPKNNNCMKARALLDCGSQSSFISASLKNNLNLESSSLNIDVIGIGNISSNKVTESCLAQIKSFNGPYNIKNNFYVLKDLTGSLPRINIDIQQLHLPENIKLADPQFHQSANIDIILGADLFWDILGSKKLPLGSTLPTLHDSKLGWLISGPISSLPLNKLNTTHCNHAHIKHCNDDLCINESLSKFWALEEVPAKSSLTPEERECEQHFLTHTSRLPSGRFCVRLPLIDTPDSLGDSYFIAKRRFINLEKRFRRHPEVKSQYVEFIREYENLGHLSESSIKKPDPSYFLCHHCVFKESSESTKIRVVFNGSQPTSSGFSVNDLQMVGPSIQDSLFSILIRARLHKYLLTGDIEKMYRQCEIHQDDRNLQLILWREDESKLLRTLRLNTVTYGFASASYLSTKCIWTLGEECDDVNIKNIIQHDFLVDDLITGADSESELIDIQHSVSKVLALGCFPLRKFRSNSTLLLEKLSRQYNNDKLYLSDSHTTLGMGWTPSSDLLHFSFNPLTHHDILTKRLILSLSLKLFDPLGLVSPCIIVAKLINQQLWLEKRDWDEPVSNKIQEDWHTLSTNLHCLTLIQIPRYVLCHKPILIELHSFSDASQKAYGACVYMRSVDPTGNCKVSLLCSKSKVAPIRAITIPRLELCAALLAANLCKAVTSSLRFDVARQVHWCDSTVVLSWLRTSTRKLKTFVANRVAEIDELTDTSCWRYISTSENPADLISRGVNPNAIESMSLWWSGPDFLVQPESGWPILSKNNLGLTEGLPELKSFTTFMVEPIIDFSRYSNLNKLINSFAYVQRFIKNIKNIKNKTIDPLILKELKSSFHLLCSMSQRESFPEEYQRLINNKPLLAKSNILQLTPFWDASSNLIRVGGRLDNSNLNYEHKHPILLHSSHHFTKLIFEREHLRQLHAGPQLLLACIRNTIWPVNGRQLARRTFRNCVKCKRLEGRTLVPMMGNLPFQRVTPDFPFRTVGIDMAGPFFTLNRKGRGSKIIKSYLCVYVCLRYKCLHLEAVSDLSKEAFLLSFRRFISRRGKPFEVFCDNGKNFVAADKEIGHFIKLNQQSIIDFANGEEIKFVFSPSYAPHFGGLWEAGVKSAKFHIKRVMGNSHLTYEELATLFAQVEALLNSRPLCPMSSSPDDLLFLTPGHFLIGRPLTALPEPRLEDLSSTSLRRYERLLQIRQHFWRRWQKECIVEMQSRTKWRTNKALLKEGDLVLLQDDNLPPLCWSLGRVKKLFPGADGISRVADIQTTRGCYRRPLTRLCPLPNTDSRDG